MAWAKKIRKFVPGAVASSMEWTLTDIMQNNDGWKFLNGRLWHNKALRNIQAVSLYNMIKFCRLRVADLNPDWIKQQQVERAAAIDSDFEEVAF